MSITSTLEDWDEKGLKTNLSPCPASSTSHLKRHVEPENWDDDFEDARKSPRKTLNPSPRQRKEGNWHVEMDLEEETEDDSVDFGFAEKEEDRTVTARSRQAALQRLSISSHTTDPPALPTTFSLYHPLPQPSPDPSFPQSFPHRSPNSSVFSVPSTAHIRPTSAFALLPSPPIHKERERRRLRKKSRPKPQGIFELASLSSSSVNASETNIGSSCSAGPSRWNRSRHSFSSDGDVDGSTSESVQPLPQTRHLRAKTPSDISSVDDRSAVTPAIGIPPVPQTPTKSAALLSRISSVKKWGVRRKRASTTPSEVIRQLSFLLPPLDFNFNYSVITYTLLDNQPQNQSGLNRTPRAQPSRASFRTNRPSTPNFLSPPPDQPKSTTIDTGVTNPAGPNWFFRASSAGNPHARTGDWSGGGTSSKGNRGKEDNEPNTRRRSESIARRSTRSRTGTAEQPFNESKAHLTQDCMESSSTSSNLVKQTSLGLIQLKRSIGIRGDVLENLAVGEASSVSGSPRKGLYVGIGLGHAVGQGGSENDDREHGSGSRHGAVQAATRSRRKSLSRFLLDRDKENESNGSSQDAPSQKEKGGSRGFMGSIRRISLAGVGKHKRTKSGNEVLISIGEGKNTASLPSLLSGDLVTKPNIKQTKANLAYSLPPLPTPCSQLSLRLPSPSSLTLGKQGSSQGSTHDLPSVFSPQCLPTTRVVSAASTQGQTSQASSVSPPFTISNILLRSETGDSPPVGHRRRTSAHSRTSGEGGVRRRKKSTSGRQSIEAGMDFVSQCNLTKDSDALSFSMAFPSNPITSADGSSPFSPKIPFKSPPTLLPPIELQPPSPPRRVLKDAESEMSHPYSSVFFTPFSSAQFQPSTVASPSKLHVPHSPNTSKPSLIQHSASLGRSTAVVATRSGPGKDGVDSFSGSNSAGGGTPLRRNSLGDLKIPARISQAQVGLRRDLGMVKEFANKIERKPRPSNVISAHADGIIVAKNTELKDIQRTYNFFVSEIQSLLDAYAAQHAEQQTRRATIPVPAGPATATTPNFFSNFKPKARIRSNTNDTTPLPSEAEVVEDPTVTEAHNAYKALASAFYSINAKYRIVWECADLLIELGGGGNPNANISTPPTSSSVPIISQSPVGFADQRSVGSKRGRERAITLAGDESKISHPPLVIPSAPSEPVVSNHDATFLHKDPSPPSMSWRASTGRHALSQRQLILLREMLNNMNAHATIAADAVDDASRHSQVDDFIPEEPSLVPSGLHTHPRSFHVGVHKEWRWGDARNSTITLPSEDSVGFDGGKTSAEKKRRSGKLGMSGLRDLLRALKRSTIEGAAVRELNSTLPVPNVPIHSTTSLSTESSTGSRRLRKLPHRHRKPKAGMAHETVCSTLRGAKEWELDPGGVHARSPYSPDLFTTPKPSPRRPSLASIFRIGRSRPAYNSETPGAPPDPMTLEVAAEDLRAQSSGTGKDSSGTDEEDWDRMDSTSDLDAAAKGLSITGRSATVRGGSRQEGKQTKNLCHQRDSFHPIRPLLTPLGPVGMSNRSFSASQPSICGTEYQRLHPSPSILSRSTRLSNVEEHIDDVGLNLGSSSSMWSTSQTYYKTQACILRAGTQLAAMSPLSDSLVLAMTPENIKPLLKNAKDVQIRLLDCIAEIRVLVNKSIGNSTVFPVGDVPP